MEELDIAFDNLAEKHYKEAEVKGQILSQQNRQIPKHSIYNRYLIFKMICICDLLNSSQHNYLRCNDKMPIFLAFTGITKDLFANEMKRYYSLKIWNYVHVLCTCNSSVTLF